ncbi:hypothetical protein LZC95_31585 [Pendulispora brunnea]|uniref:Uncharacterized protein n=1 Tax=Pendulispora brunnea TaxID=2905690 RepID=A0ABZ2KP96_9BACT
MGSWTDTLVSPLAGVSASTVSSFGFTGASVAASGSDVSGGSMTPGGEMGDPSLELHDQNAPNDMQVKMARDEEEER